MSQVNGRSRKVPRQALFESLWRWDESRAPRSTIACPTKPTIVERGCGQAIVDEPKSLG
ncbi:hypothetical protein [Argonema antarcticum]|uniref:hypothetical protein n=1 Tax=Argonema antarcticum TaxID=2942763 RepID=UPI002011665A|nr:hypothetical protein [Argonema antarcticum]MCL1473336.1 hypothetical protein [Argonema antarcticum A004/B2]